MPLNQNGNFDLLDYYLFQSNILQSQCFHRASGSFTEEFFHFKEQELISVGNQRTGRKVDSDSSTL